MEWIKQVINKTIQNLESSGDVAIVVDDIRAVIAGDNNPNMGLTLMEGKREECVQELVQSNKEGANGFHNKVLGVVFDKKSSAFYCMMAPHGEKLSSFMTRVGKGFPERVWKALFVQMYFCTHLSGESNPVVNVYTPRWSPPTVIVLGRSTLLIPCHGFKLKYNTNFAHHPKRNPSREPPKSLFEEGLGVQGMTPACKSFLLSRNFQDPICPFCFFSNPLFDEFRQTDISKNPTKPEFSVQTFLECTCDP